MVPCDGDGVSCVLCVWRPIPGFRAVGSVRTHVGMTTFDSGQHPRGAAGKFTTKSHRDADVSLVAGDGGGDGPTVTLPDGTREWRREGRLHRVGGPAVELPDGGTEWWVDGKRHRVGGPALVHANGDEWWAVDGLLHREDGPAVVRPGKWEAWHSRGVKHRVGGPAVVWPKSGRSEWWSEGELHRLDGPAVVDEKDGVAEWWRRGKKVKPPRGAGEAPLEGV